MRQDEFYYKIIGCLLVQKWNHQKRNDLVMAKICSSRIRYFISEWKKEYFYSDNCVVRVLNYAIKEATSLGIDLSNKIKK